MPNLIFVLLIIFSPFAYAIDSKLSCKVFVHGMPKADLEIDFTGTTSIRDSVTITGKNGKFHIELVWDGYYEGVPLNPEMRILYLNLDETSVILEAYKNFDLQKYSNEYTSENDDNIGVRTADEIVYLSCDYLKINRR
ncbi:MAG: hypothetical protein A4S09_07060 [Proteobacteria bacterium SG_bin7]|nr:MAG: hypothetical protein A4S09_07060 [Proteobacteria bacterium SG_bin7]